LPRKYRPSPAHTASWLDAKPTLAPIHNPARRQRRNARRLRFVQVLSERSYCAG
jgi:hypothetical protein